MHIHVTTVIAADLVYRKKTMTQTMSVTAHIYAPHHTRRTFNSVQIYRQLALFLPPASLYRWQFCSGAMKQRTCVESKTASKRTTSHSRTQIYMYTCQIHERDVYQRSIQYVLLMEKACNFPSLYAHAHRTYTHIFSKPKRQTACEHTRWSTFGNFVIVYILELVSFCCWIVAIAMIIFVTHKNIVWMTTYSTSQPKAIAKSLTIIPVAKSSKY